MTARPLQIWMMIALLFPLFAKQAANAVPLLAVDFGGQLANSELQPGFQGMWGTNDNSTAATFGAYTVQLSANNTQPTGSAAPNRGFFTKLPGGRIDMVDASIRDFYRDFFFNRSIVNGEGVDLKITGLTPNVPYTLTLSSFDADASPTVVTKQQWAPKAGSNTTGTSGTIDMVRMPVPTSLWDPLYTTSIQVTTTTGVLDVFGTTSVGARGTVLNGFKLNDFVSDVLSVDLGEGSAATVQPGFQHMTGPDVTDMATQAFGAYTITAERVGGVTGDTGFYNEYAIRMGTEILPPATHNMFRDCFYNVSIFPGEGVKLTIDGVTPNTEYDLTIWDMDPALPMGFETPTSWSPTGDTTGDTGNVVNVRVPVPQDINDPSHLTTIRVKSTTNKLEIFGTTSDGVGGVRLNAIALNAISTEIPGDFDGDSDVDGVDLAAWGNDFGASTGANRAMGDADGDADVDGADFLAWQQNFGSGAAVGTIPEPNSLGILVLASLSIVWTYRARH